MGARMARDLGVVFGGRWIMNPVYGIDSNGIEGQAFTVPSVGGVMDHIEGKQEIPKEYLVPALWKYLVDGKISVTLRGRWSRR